MDFWIWLLLGLLVAVGGAGLWLRRLRAQSATVFAEQVTPERAKLASAKLTEAQHREVYRALASDHLLGAAQAIRNATHASARDSLIEAQALRAFPQVWTAARPAAPADSNGSGASGLEAQEFPASGAASPEPNAQGSSAAGSNGSDTSGAAPQEEPRNPAPEGADGAAGASAATAGEGGLDDWAIPEDWADEYGGEHSGERHMEFTHHDGTELRRFSTQDLPAAERDQLMSQLRDGELADAARLIADRVGIDAGEVETALRANHEAGHDRVDGIAVRFDRGDGEAVEFSTQSLPDEERALFISALQADDLITAAQVVSRHTGISPEQALTLLETFRRRRD